MLRTVGLLLTSLQGGLVLTLAGRSPASWPKLYWALRHFN